MPAESTLQTSLLQLAIDAQVPLLAESLRPSMREPSDVVDSNGPLYVRIGVPLPVSVQSEHGRMMVRGNLEKMNWSLYEEISAGLRKLVAERLKVDVSALAMTQLLMVGAGEAMQYVEIEIPTAHGNAFASADSQEEVGTYLHVLSGRAIPENASDGGDSFARAVEIAREVRTAIGGKTLPAACIISSTGWETALQLSGKLGDKPEPPPSKPEDHVILCHVDGYLKKQRQLHLLPLAGVDKDAANQKREARKIVAFDEERWFARIAALAAERGRVVQASYRRVVVGKRELLQLTDLAPLPAALP